MGPLHDVPIRSEPVAETEGLHCGTVLLTVLTLSVVDTEREPPSRKERNGKLQLQGILRLLNFKDLHLIAGGRR